MACPGIPDIADGRRMLVMPGLETGGAGSRGAVISDHLRHVADNARAVGAEGAGHRVAEEQPAAVTDALLRLLPAAR